MLKSNCIKCLLISLTLLTVASCGNGDQNQVKKDAKIANLNIENENGLTLPYQPEYYTIDSAILTIKVLALPSLFDLEVMHSQAKLIEADGEFKTYGVEKVYHVIDHALDLKFCEANEVGFRKRYEHFIVAKVGQGYTLDCGLKIGDPARLLVESKRKDKLVKQKSIRYDKLSVIQFYDHWNIYTHTYHIKDGLIESLEIAF